MQMTKKTLNRESVVECGMNTECFKNTNHYCLLLINAINQCKRLFPYPIHVYTKYLINYCHSEKKNHVKRQSISKNAKEKKINTVNTKYQR